MTSAVKICNAALSLIGASARVASISPPDGTVEAGYCASFYDLVRREALERCTPRFALRRADLSALDDNPSTAWAYAYALPSTCLKPLRVVRAAQGLTVFTQDEARYDPTDRGGADFDVEGTTLFCNEPDAQLVYLADVEDVGRFTPLFTNGMAQLLASYLAGPIMKGQAGTRVGASWRQAAYATLAEAGASAANASQATNNYTPAAIAARA